MLHEEITQPIIQAAMKVHSALGAGLLESAYAACLCYEFGQCGLHFQHQVKLPVVYGTVSLDAGYRLDFLVADTVIVFLVADTVIVELKAVEKLLPLHTAQLLTYMKLSGHKVGLLLNFNVAHMRDGIRRHVLG